MGLFASRPEEPTEWAGLPSEPLTADSLGPLPPDTVATDAGGLFGIAPVESIAISIPLTPFTDPSDDESDIHDAVDVDADADADDVEADSDADDVDAPEGA